MNSKHLIRILSTLLVVIVLFGVVQSAAADLKATSVFYALSDTAPPQYKNSLVFLELDGEATHVIHELGFDNDDYYYTDNASDRKNSTPVFTMCQKVKANPSKLVDCPIDNDDNPTNSPPEQYEKFAGVMELGIPREAVGNGALAFNNSDSWELIDCDLNGSGTFTNADLNVDTRLPANRPAVLAPWDSNLAPNTGTSGFNFKVLAIDELRNCQNNTCKTELVTTIFLDLDVNNNDVVDKCAPGVAPWTGGCELPASGSICFFAEIYPVVYKPGDPVWSGNPQARITAGGGDKTVNFRLLGPTAITLEKLAAQSPGGIHPYIWLSIFVLLGGIAFILIRESRIQANIRRD